MIRFEACAGPGSTGRHLPGCPRGSSPRPQGLSGEVAELRLLRRMLEEETGGHTLPHTLERLTLCCAWPGWTRPRGRASASAPGNATTLPPRP